MAPAYILYRGDDWYGSKPDNVTAIYTFGTAGVKQLGRIGQAALADNRYFQANLSTCRYIDSFFYVVPGKLNDFTYPFDNRAFRMELVRLTP